MGQTSWRCYCGTIVVGQQAARAHADEHEARGERRPGRPEAPASLLAERLAGYVASPTSFTENEKDALLREAAAAGVDDGSWREPFAELYEVARGLEQDLDEEHDDGCPAAEWGEDKPCECRLGIVRAALKAARPIYARVHEHKDWQPAERDPRIHVCPSCGAAEWHDLYQDSGGDAYRNMACRRCPYTLVISAR